MPPDNTPGPAVLATYPADHLSTLRTRELQDIMRAARTLPLESLLNHGAVTIDPATRRIVRDSFWKGSFAKDTLLGWEERLATPIRANRPAYTGGRFWKRFDDIHDGHAFGYVINYGVTFLPGRPKVRQLPYPDDTRRYVRADDAVLLLSYLNPPYRIVYDLIKVVDANNCIGVMHLGKFPRGREFATFVLARNNYPFVKMAVPDHDAIFASTDQSRVPAPADLAGSWTGYLVFLERPDLALHNQFNLPLLRFGFNPGGSEARVRFIAASSTKQVRREDGVIRLTDGTASADEIRQIDADTLIGRRVRQGSGDVVRRYVLERTV
jgi:hypothetical protein